MTTDILFLSVFHNLPGVLDGAEVCYYVPGDSEILRRDLASAIEHYFTLFSESFEYQDYFAEYEIYEDSLAAAELEIFRSVLKPVDRTVPLGDLHPRDTFRGCRAVVGACVRDPDLALNRRGIELFNFVMECALPTDDKRNPQCCIQLETAKEFAPRFIDDLLDIVRSTGEIRWAFPRRYHRREALRPLQTLLETLARAIR
jgi:hypothetical protein